MQVEFAPWCDQGSDRFLVIFSATSTWASSARDRASMPSAQSLPLARVVFVNCSRRRKPVVFRQNGGCLDQFWQHQRRESDLLRALACLLAAIKAPA